MLWGKGRLGLALLRRGRAVLDLLYPQDCLACGGGMPRAPACLLCERCRSALPLIGPWHCPQCGDATGPFAEGAAACPSCAPRQGMVFRGAIAACRFEGPAREMVHRLKYSGDTRAVEWMGREMALRARKTPWWPAVEVIIPVPLHWTRRFTRRFNQSELLARALSRDSRPPCAPELLRRTRRTPAQVTLEPAAREQNVKGAFAASHPERVKGRTVLLVDDVMTTCATARECARVLRNAGARATYVAVFAR
jgi:ComF family protein